ncbi:hypothetical protein KIN20_034622 [Parelaphostrongylus tenuis]|uniref:Major facilitator superfamily (MFS) profile domain-containing protein n=1 Tax=Parelaphostrongylus tenuis TaxID=148309 RepID=A0AAD5WJ45_PARTN|nr:hypothetical protein KIN20_034622 [Parelaphostrongylus tenuis]
MDTSDATKPSHIPKMGWFVYMLSFSAVIGGFFFGYDTGIISAGMLFVPENSEMRPMEHIWQEIIVSVTPGFAAVGALLSANGSDRFGRKKVIVVASIVYSVGGVICGVAWAKSILAFGRILLGVAIGEIKMS